MATTTVTVNGFVRAPGTPVTDGNIAVFDTVTGELIADGGKTITELTVDKSTGGNGAADAGKVLEFQAGGQIQGSAEDTGIPAVSGLSTGGDNGVYGGSVNGNGVYGESTNGNGFYGGSTGGNGVYAKSANREGVISQSDATTYAAIKAKNTNSANTAQLALFQNSDNDGLEVTNNGSLDWTLPLAKQQTRVNMLPALAGNAAKVLAVNGAADDVEWVAASGGGGPITIRTYTGTTDALVLTDAGNWVRSGNAAANIMTIPTNASVAFPIGTQIAGNQYGAGQMSIAPAGGVTLNSSGGARKLVMQYSPYLLTKTGTNEWHLTGEITT